MLMVAWPHLMWANKLKRELSRGCFPGCMSAFKLSVYADDMVIILNKLSDIQILEEEF